MHIYTPLGLGRDNIPEDCDEASHLGSELCHCIADIVWSTHTLSADFWGQRQAFLGSQEVKQQRTRYRTVSISEFEGKNLNPYEMHPPCISLMFGNISGFDWMILTVTEWQDENKWLTHQFLSVFVFTFPKYLWAQYIISYCDPSALSHPYELGLKHMQVPGH